MASTMLSLALLSLGVAPAIATPVGTKHFKRDPMGPQINGANFPDPGLFLDSTNTWYAFSTNSGGFNIQVASSTDFNTWGFVADSNGNQVDALPSLPPWVAPPPSNVWAPSVAQLTNGTYIMYYSATYAQNTTHHCVGAAYSDSIAGPYTPQTDPLYCNMDIGGAIDPSAYSENGQLYALYKVDGNSLDTGSTIYPTPIMLQPVEADGVTPSGDATTLIDNSGSQDMGIVEAPSLIKVADTYFLFYSSGLYTTSNYTVSYATATSVTGPYTPAAGPLLQSGDYGLTAPGGATVWTDGVHMVFHANSDAGRSLYTALLTIDGTTVTIN